MFVCRGATVISVLLPDKPPKPVIASASLRQQTREVLGRREQIRFHEGHVLCGSFENVQSCTAKKPQVFNSQNETKNIPHC